MIGALRPKGRRFKFHFRRHVRTLGKSFTRSCLYNAMWRSLPRPTWLPFD